MAVLPSAPLAERGDGPHEKIRRKVKLPFHMSGLWIERDTPLSSSDSGPYDDSARESFRSEIIILIVIIAIEPI